MEPTLQTLRMNAHTQHIVWYEIALVGGQWRRTELNYD